MENINENPIVEETTYEAPVFEAPVAEDSVLEAPVAEAVVETPVVEEVQAVVETPAYQAPEEVQALGSVAEGVIGASKAPKTPKKKAAPKVDKNPKNVAIKSTKNVSWVGVGKVSKGINIVSQNEADQWLTRDHITLVSPEQVKSEFGN